MNSDTESWESRSTTNTGRMRRGTIAVKRDSVVKSCLCFAFSGIAPVLPSTALFTGGSRAVMSLTAFCQSILRTCSQALPIGLLVHVETADS